MEEKTVYDMIKQYVDIHNAGIKDAQKQKILDTYIISLLRY